ncbi:hypothetical protein HK097_000663 [Rhizophlyctis rosea]|uniref:Uncharacterized protein n=1 Tax=Rhizophlyctis rosea TaxID=64517 RepID=A0AAD5X1A4_9FUNG|nr:hypothetical protein HK097_000663 [Rhizophlyctis rosea]
MTCDGGTLLHDAIGTGTLEVVRLMVEHGADVNLETAGWTPLAFARHIGVQEVVQFLEEKGAVTKEPMVDQAPSASNGHDRSSLRYGAQRNDIEFDARREARTGPRRVTKQRREERMKQKIKLIFLVAAIIAAVVLGGASYGMGKEDDNKQSPGYKSGVVFTSIASVVWVVLIVLLISTVTLIKGFDGGMFSVGVTLAALLVDYLHVDGVAPRAVTGLEAEADQRVQDRFAGEKLQGLQDASSVRNLGELLSIPCLAADQPLPCDIGHCGDLVATGMFLEEPDEEEGAPAGRPSAGAELDEEGWG